MTTPVTGLRLGSVATRFDPLLSSHIDGNNIDNCHNNI